MQTPSITISTIGGGLKIARKLIKLGRSIFFTASKAASSSGKI